MVSLRPRSIFQLTITGFLLVTAILVAALIIIVRQLNELGNQSQQIISQTAMAMQSSRTLIEQASAMERNALQYDVVGDSEILAVYADRRKTFGNAAQQLSNLNLGEEMVVLINSLVRNEAIAYQTLATRNLNGPGNDEAVYPGLLEVTYRISDLVNRWTQEQLQAIRSDTMETQSLLTIQAVMLIGTALLLAAVFTALITRPLLQIEKSINLLGRGKYEQEIRVTGPRDLTNLGNLLDWLRNRLQKLEQQRSSFFRHVSHELKTPLAAMQESASLLNDGAVGHLNREQQEIIRIQQNNCQRLQTLIDDLLRYNAGSFSVLSTMPLTVHLDKVIRNVVKNHELTIRSCDINVSSTLGKVAVRGNEEQVRVVVDNLLTNAIKYSPRGGSILLSLYASEDRAIFEIRDQGPGIREQDRQKIFDPFFQGQPSDRDFLKGSGLGLAIAREYTEANGGALRLCKSSRGAHFLLSFPLSGKETT